MTAHVLPVGYVTMLCLAGRIYDPGDGGRRVLGMSHWETESSPVLITLPLKIHVSPVPHRHSQQTSLVG